MGAESPDGALRAKSRAAERYMKDMDRSGTGGVKMVLLTQRNLCIDVFTHIVAYLELGDVLTLRLVGRNWGNLATHYGFELLEEKLSKLRLADDITRKEREDGIATKVRDGSSSLLRNGLSFGIFAATLPPQGWVIFKLGSMLVMANTATRVTGGLGVIYCIGRPYWTAEKVISHGYSVQTKYVLPPIRGVIGKLTDLLPMGMCARGCARTVMFPPNAFRTPYIILRPDYGDLCTPFVVTPTDSKTLDAGEMMRMMYGKSGKAEDGEDEGDESEYEWVSESEEGAQGSEPDQGNSEAAERGEEAAPDPDGYDLLRDPFHVSWKDPITPVSSMVGWTCINKCNGIELHSANWALGGPPFRLVAKMGQSSLFCMGTAKSEDTAWWMFTRALQAVDSEQTFTAKGTAKQQHQYLSVLRACKKLNHRHRKELRGKRGRESTRVCGFSLLWS